MRIVIVFLLAIIAVTAGGVWALGQFGDTLTSGGGEARAPLVREPEIIAATEPAKPSAPNAEPALRSTLAAPKQAEPAPASEPAPSPVEQDQPAGEPKVNLRSTLDEKGGFSIPGVTEPKVEKAPNAPPAEQVVQPQSMPTPAEPEPRIVPQQASSASATASVSGLESQFKARKVTYNRPPEKLALDKPVDVSLVINATENENAGKEALQGFPGTIVERDVELSDTVSAQLTGVGFDITSQTVERQRLSGKTVNRWAWRITPTELGQHTLILEIFGYASGSLDAEPLDAYRDVITVEVQQFDQIVNWAKSVQPVFAVLAALAAVGSAAFAFLRFREEKKQTKAMSSRSDP